MVNETEPAEIADQSNSERNVVLQQQGRWPEEITTATGEVLAALGHSIRIGLLRAVASGARPSEVAATHGVTDQALTGHWRILQDAGLVVPVPNEGRETSSAPRKALTPFGRVVVDHILGAAHGVLEACRSVRDRRFVAYLEKGETTIAREYIGRGFPGGLAENDCAQVIDILEEERQ